MCFNITWKSQREELLVAKQALKNRINGRPVGDMVDEVLVVEPYAFVTWGRSSLVFRRSLFGFRYLYTENYYEEG